jgi:CheY-like chemotaxis protein
MSKQTILYVDDDRDDQELFIEVLRDIEPSYQCIVANDGLQALASLANLNPLPICMYIDLNMPKLDGWELLTMLKENKCYDGIPKFIISTAQITSHIEKAKLLGAKDFLTKPNSYNDFVVMLKSCFVTHLRAAV